MKQTTLKTDYRELDDGLGTVALQLNLPLARLQQLERIAEDGDQWVNTLINEVLGEYVFNAEFQSDKAHPDANSAREIHQLQALNQQLMLKLQQIEQELEQIQAPTPKRKSNSARQNRKLRKGESSSLQLLFAFMTKQKP